MIQLESVTERTELLDPAGNRTQQIVEHRTDPLTGTVASINAALGEKAKAFLGGADLALLAALEERSRATCPFCDASAKGTRFLPERVPGGQLRVGRALAIPNLFAKAGFDAVVILDPALHVVYPSRIPAPALADAIDASAELVRRARAHDPSFVHHVAGMNLLGPAGSSVPHPHFQVHARSVPYSALARAARLADDFRARAGRSFWAALLEQERGGPRHLGATGAVEWLAAWAPARQKEVWGILPGVASLAALSEGDAEAFAAGIAKVLAAYEEGGAHAFNFAFHSSPDPGATGSWALHVRICARPAFQAQLVNYDTWFAPLYMGDDVHLESPEALAARIRARW
jgi:galactose-1-phosphate uridylyltransferase